MLVALCISVWMMISTFGIRLSGLSSLLEDDVQDQAARPNVVVGRLVPPSNSLCWGWGMVLRRNGLYNVFLFQPRKLTLGCLDRSRDVVHCEAQAQRMFQDALVWSWNWFSKRLLDPLSSASGSSDPPQFAICWRFSSRLGSVSNRPCFSWSVKAFSLRGVAERWRVNLGPNKWDGPYCRLSSFAKHQTRSKRSKPNKWRIIGSLKPWTIWTIRVLRCQHPRFLQRADSRNGGNGSECLCQSSRTCCSIPCSGRSRKAVRREVHKECSRAFGRQSS